MNSAYWDTGQVNDVLPHCVKFCTRLSRMVGHVLSLTFPAPAFPATLSSHFLCSHPDVECLTGDAPDTCSSQCRGQAQFIQAGTNVCHVGDHFCHGMDAIRVLFGLH